MYEIPITSDPNQNFKCTIPVDGENRSFIFNLKYNTQAKYWTMTISDDITGKMLIDSLPLISGEYPSANLLEQYSYLNIGSAVIIKANPDIEIDCPDEKNLGTGFKLIWGDTL